MKRFVVAAEGMSPEQQKAWLEFIKEKGLGWWHWIDNLWLLVDRPEEMTTATLRDQITEKFGATKCIVIEIEPGGTWSGLGPSSPKPMFKWIKETWME